MVQCMTRPRVTYNGTHTDSPHVHITLSVCVPYTADTLKQDAGECSICLDDMLIGMHMNTRFLTYGQLLSTLSGEEIARLPCLCIYHLK